MKRLLLLLTLFYELSGYSQEEEIVYTDTVDIVDFLESVYKEEPKYFNEGKNDPKWSYYELKNVVLYSGYDSFPAQKIELALAIFGHEFHQSPYTSEVFPRLANRLKIDSIKFPSTIKIKNCLLISSKFRKGESVYFTSGIDFEKIHFTQLEIEGCRTPIASSGSNKHSATLNFKDCDFGPYDYYGKLLNDNKIKIRYEDCRFHSKTAIKHIDEYISISESSFYGKLDLSTNSRVEIKDNIFYSSEPDTLLYDSASQVLIKKHGGSKSWISRDRLEDIEYENLKNVNRIATEFIRIEISENDQSNGLKMTGNTFHAVEGIPNWINLDFNCRIIEMKDNTGPFYLSLGKSKVEDQISFKNNSGLKAISMSSLIFSEYKNYFDWESIKGNKLISQIPYSGKFGRHLFKYANGKDVRVVKNNDTYYKLKEIYKFLYDNYKNQGATVYANGCYAEMKQVENLRWKYLFEQDKNFESFFRWQLNAFLSYFTDYGTNPAKAVIKSGWVILLFAIFYLFFPSDWDVSNRSQLLSKVKDLTSKNREKTFIATLAFVAYSAFIHILNALTLSLNAFTTLGFGDIPTHGAARYVTIVQGFIGWFLLTIFSVSLINQVLG
jgi:hypothetical protein